MNIRLLSSVLSAIIIAAGLLGATAARDGAAAIESGSGNAAQSPTASVDPKIANGSFTCPNLGSSGAPGLDPRMDGLLTMAERAIAALPMRAASAICMMAADGLAEGGLAGPGAMSRRDALWLQAGYGEGRSSSLEGGAFDYPKWSAADPALLRFLPGQADETMNAPSLFSFQIGR